MLAKMTSKNQITIPKKALQALGLASEAEPRYFDVDTRNGHLILKPVIVSVEERIPDQQLAKFERWASTIHQGDLVFDSAREATAALKKRIRRP
jgi:bifunctional DNA-binding transcriptional regulator/antitoxin component of YhaV-PrlF toxin-antitoxin module